VSDLEPNQTVTVGPHQTDRAITAFTANALLERADLAGLRSIAWALALADEQQRHWLTAAVDYQDPHSHAAAVELVNNLLVDPDPQVREGARHLSTWLAAHD
jgi:hypothetical protein